MNLSLIRPSITDLTKDEVITLLREVRQDRGTVKAKPTKKVKVKTKRFNIDDLTPEEAQALLDKFG